MSEYHVIMGLPGAGKTTYAEEHIVPDKTPIIMTTEAYAQKVQGEPRMTPAAWDEFYRHLGEALSGDEVVVIDGNNTHGGSRMRIAQFARQHGASTHLHVLCTPPIVCIQRARAAGRELEGRVIRNQVEKFITSLPSIPTEPWDEVRWIRADELTDEA